ncbi:MAG: ATP phosphoribosyltransferase regulatory subunit [Acetobacteraceae bacterium]
MTDDPPAHPALLPSGFRDLLPEAAEEEAQAIATLMAVFAGHGYQRVKPPLLEFQEGLFAGSGAALAEQTFRLMDPLSQRMMGLRADITPQVARIATTRLAAVPRPLRLSYAGQCVRVAGSELAPERQIGQAGIELVGEDSLAADTELLLVGAEALGAVGIGRVSVDLTLPTLVPALLEAAGLDAAARAPLARALDRKDAAAVARHGGPLAGLLADLLLAAGPAARALAALAAAALPDAARALAERLAATVAAVAARAPNLLLTVDPVEFRGLRYHTGLAFTFYAPGRRIELGRGGRYLGNAGEPATGLTLYPDRILAAIPPLPARPRLFIPWGADPAQAAARRAEGFATVAALSPHGPAAAEARRLLCTHYLEGGTNVPLAPEHA